MKESYGPSYDAMVVQRDEQSKLEAQELEVRDAIGDFDADRAEAKLPPAKNEALEKRLADILEQLVRVRSARSKLEPRGQKDVEKYLDAERSRTYNAMCEHNAKTKAVVEKLNEALIALHKAQEAVKVHDAVSVTLMMRHNAAASALRRFRIEHMGANAAALDALERVQVFAQ